MKLYTEEQVKRAISLTLDSPTHSNLVLDHLTPIELPSDEEIDAYLKSFPYTKHLDCGQYNEGVIDGAELGIEWFKNRIQGGNK